MATRYCQDGVAHSDDKLSLTLAARCWQAVALAQAASASGSTPTPGMLGTSLWTNCMGTHLSACGFTAAPPQPSGGMVIQAAACGETADQAVDAADPMPHPWGKSQRRASASACAAADPMPHPRGGSPTVGPALLHVQQLMLWPVVDGTHLVCISAASRSRVLVMLPLGSCCTVFGGRAARRLPALGSRAASNSPATTSNSLAISTLAIPCSTWATCH
jgi:hypothetical protein